MGFLSLPSIFFKKKKNKTKITKRGKSASNLTDEPSTGGQTECDAGALVLTKEEDVPPNASPELRVVREWIRCKDQQDVDKMKELTADDCFFTFVDSETEMPAREFFGAMQDIYASFPDLHFFWESMSIKGQDKDGSVLVAIQDYYGIGKHTGAPYFFGPYPPVPTSNKTVRDENIEFTFTVKNGKITNATIDAFGMVVGPPGFYTKIGGVVFW